MEGNIPTVYQKIYKNIYKNIYRISLLIIGIWIFSINSAYSQASPSLPTDDLDLNPEIIENSPVLQRWLKQVPNILEEINNDPSFRTRVRVGYVLFPSHNQRSGINLGIEDLLIGDTPVALRGEYATSFDGQLQTYGVDLQYYLRPLGSYINVAPVVGYRNLSTNFYHTQGINLGAKLLLNLSRGGGADITLMQTWVTPKSSEEVGLTRLSLGYALTKHLRFSTDIQQQNAPQRKERRFGLVFEWMP